MFDIRGPIRSDHLLTVTIYLEPDDGGGMHITYRPAVLHALPGDRIKWQCNDGPFVIEFKGQTPVGKVYIHSHPSHETDPADAVIPDHPRPGHYHYAVVVQTEGRLYIDAGCPEIIIES